MDLDIFFLEVGISFLYVLNAKMKWPSLQQPLQQVAYYAEKRWPDTLPYFHVNTSGLWIQ